MVVCNVVCVYDDDYVCRWFLHPPANKIYSKQHPLLWYMTSYADLADGKVREIDQSDERVLAHYYNIMC